MRRGGLLSISFSLLVVAACVSSQNAIKVEAALGQKCALDSDCTSPNKCVYERCHAECEADADCENGQRCVKGELDGSQICQLQSEVACSADEDCEGEQICGKDGECRDACIGDSDCIAPQACVTGTCASPEELVDGELPVTGTEGKECHWDSDCPGDLFCVSGVCGPECKGPKDCFGGLVCVDGVCAASGTCGDGVKTADEECDGIDAGGQLCSNGDPVACTAACTLDFAACPSVCGDGIQGPDEECDTVANGVCPGGVMETCSATCEILCPDQCGDGVAGPSEACDGADLKGLDCMSQGFGGGALACDAGCKLILKACIDGCGNDVPEGPEPCDGQNFGGKTCNDFFPGTIGPLFCSPNCDVVDTANCMIPPPNCGDGLIGVGESCDGGNLGGLSCSTFGFGGGMLFCDGNCQFDTSACTSCGNGVIDGPMEFCDGMDLGGESCSNLGFRTGSLGCGPNCQFDTSMCF
jgi:hypothetical protein